MTAKIIKQTIIISLLLLLTTSVTPAVMAHMEAGDDTATPSSHTETVEDVLSDILPRTGKSDLSQLSCNLVDELEFERLGDALMEQNHPGRAHTIMDQMMGGEGSDSLREMHIQMGKNYLGCGTTAGLIGSNSTANQSPTSNMPYQMPGMGWMSALVSLSALIFFISGTYYFLTRSRVAK